MVLIGLSGIEKRLARYPQLFSRVGFVHHYRPLAKEELRFVLAHKWAELGLTFAPDDYTDAEALAAIARITGGNFRLVQRLFSQIARILEINRLRTLTKEGVEAARENLVVGPLVCPGRTARSPPESTEETMPLSVESDRTRSGDSGPRFS